MCAVVGRRHDEIAALLADGGEPSTPEARILALIGRINSLEVAGRRAEAEATLFEALELARCTGNLRAQGQLLHRRGSMAANLRADEEALAWYAQARAAFGRCGDAVGLGRCDAAEGMIALSRGDVRTALVAFERALPTAAGSVQVDVGLRMQLGIANHLAGNLERARRWLAECPTDGALPTLAVGVALHLAAVEAELGLDGAARLAAVRTDAERYLPDLLAILALAVELPADARDHLLAVDRSNYGLELGARVVEAMIRRRDG